jgi:hypothetical protein
LFFRKNWRCAALSAVVAAMMFVPAAAQAEIFDGVMPQTQVDLSQVGSSNSNGGWGDMSGGVAARPYIKEMSVINGGIETPVITGGAAGGSGLGSGGLGAVIEPINLCKAGTTPAPGQCYSTPNRVQLTVIYTSGMNTGWNFLSANAQSVTPLVTANTVIDLTVGLNTLGRNLRWSWATGDLLYWHPTALGTPDATVRIKFKPAVRPDVEYAPGTGCSATPIFNCNITSPQGDGLGATLLLSLDNTLNPALTGAVFATQGAIAGFLEPGTNPTAPSLDMQIASSHFDANGALRKGRLKAFIPAGALMNLYGLVPVDAVTNFTTTRTGSTGTNGTPIYSVWTVAHDGADGVMVDVRDISFSVPKYRVAGKSKLRSSSAKAKRGKTTVKSTVPACAKAKGCTGTVYDLGTAAKQWQAARKRVASRTRIKKANISFVVATAKLKKGHRYLIVLKSVKTKKLVASSVGTVK